MHIEKNVFENIFETVMDIEGKTIDNAKAREDIKIYCKRKDLEKNESMGKYPKACYSLGKKEKKVVCDWVAKLNFPDGYVSNMSRFIDMQKYKLFGMKSHDCHVFMQRLIPIAFRELLPVTVWKALIKVEDMLRLNEDIPVILCKLEGIFPPSLFDSMEHLPVHLAYEARVAGPVQYRWMYPFERYLGKLKKKVTNKAKVEGSIANAYLIEETSMFCSHYFEPHVSTKMNVITPRNDDGGDVEQCDGNISIFMSPGRLSGSRKKRRLIDQEYDAARIYVLLNCVEIEEYVKIFVEEKKTSEPNLTDQQIESRLHSDFANWFKIYAHNSNNVDNRIIKDVALGPLRNVTTYPVYFVNGYKFHTRDHGSNRSTFNSGVCLKGSSYGNLSSDYYGILVEIVQLEYPALPIKSVVLFKCDWFDPTPNVGVKIHKEYNLVDVNHKRRFKMYEPFILASQSLQVYYASYPTLRRGKVKPRPNIDLPIDSMAFQDDEVEAHSVDVVDQVSTPLNDPSGVLVDIDDGNDDVQFGEDDDDTDT
ncbi:uncharacterized protein [Rutidosis leptorrhynchoides]|uniref:uncharacterized protein n=1 Tax=Rutidosis leptorrhynchoides TaxID=125765 RepID=UPI003A990CD6